jgi:hypothetical protein
MSDNPIKKIHPPKTKWTYRVGRPKLRWMDETEDDLKLLSVREWR